jgi:hypothetical protein
VAPAGGSRPLAAAGLRSCGEVGPSSCEIAPSTPAALCSSLGPCILKHAHEANYLEDLTLGCELGSNGSAPVFVGRVQAPAASGLRATAVAQLVAGTEFMVQFGASYLARGLTRNPPGHKLR